MAKVAFTADEAVAKGLSPADEAVAEVASRVRENYFLVILGVWRNPNSTLNLCFRLVGQMDRDMTSCDVSDVIHMGCFVRRNT